MKPAPKATRPHTAGHTLRRLAAAALALAALAGMTTACNGDDDNDNHKTWTKYAAWRDANNLFFSTQRDSLDADGRLFYQPLFPTWNPSAEILVHYFNDRAATAGNLQPMLTSTCDVIYYVRQIDGTPVDSSYTHNAYGPGIVRLKPQNTIQGMAIALMDMHVGDSVQLVIPYTLAYGASTAQQFPPYSTLVFNVRLADIPAYEIR